VEAEEWLESFDRQAQVRVLTSKHHEDLHCGQFDTQSTLPADRQHATRDIVGELTAA